MVVVDSDCSFVEEAGIVNHIVHPYCITKFYELDGRTAGQMASFQLSFPIPVISWGIKTQEPSYVQPP